jgi:hypothetical protein
MSTLSQQVPAPEDVVVDLYVAWPDAPADPDELSGLLRAALLDAPQLARGRRVTVTVYGDGGELVRQQTFRDSGGGMAEDQVIRDMHPLTGQRLDLWRLKNFDGTRLPSPENTYLFHCVAKENPADERLVALAEVRDVTPLRDAAGQVTAFPAVERALGACLDGIRQHQATRGDRRLDTNLVLLYVWPTMEVSLAELAGFAQAAAPLTVGAGLEEVTILGRLREGPDTEPREVALSFAHRPGTGVAVSVQPPPDRADRPDGRLHPAGAPRPRPRHHVPVRAGPGHHRRGGARSSSTTWTPTACWPRSSGHPGATPPASSPAWSGPPPPATRRAW